MISSKIVSNPKQIAFQGLRNNSLEYLNTVDSRNLIGWEKIDPLLQNIMHLLHQNPHTFHYGESCSGHLSKRNSSSTISQGYITVGVDESQEAVGIVKDLIATATASPYVSIKNARVPFYQEGNVVGEVNVYPIRLNLENKNLETLSTAQHLTGFKKTWKAIETTLQKHTEHYDSLWNPEQTAHLRPNWSKEFLAEQSPLAA